MSVLHTVEVRWFFGECPFSAASYFLDQHRAEKRTDWYALPSDTGCGIKIREGRLESKLRSKSLGKVRLSSDHCGLVEAWSKWSVELTLEAAPSASLLRNTNWRPIDKWRAVRRFDLVNGQVSETANPQPNGCSFELTKLGVDGRLYWTIGFEAIHEDHEQGLRNLRRVFEYIDHESPLPRLDSDCSRGYPHWLNHLPRDAAS